MNEAARLKRAQSILARLLVTRDAMLVTIGKLAVAIAAAVGEVAEAETEAMVYVAVDTE